MNKAIFTGGLRTPFGRAFKGAYAEVRPDDLLVNLLREQERRHPELWEQGAQDLITGCAYPEGEQGYNVARMAALGVGLEVPGLTVNRLCASSLDATTIAAARVRSGWANQLLVTGVESMSRVKRRGEAFTESDDIKAVSPQAYVTMGNTAENIAAAYQGISRSEQEDFAERSHQLAHEAYRNGFYQDQVIEFLTAKDELIRYPVDRAKMASLSPCFARDGEVTAATSSPLTDGATSAWILSEDRAREVGIKEGLEILHATWVPVAPELMGLGPVEAVRTLLKTTGVQVEEVAAWEFNEAFSIQCLACLQELSLPHQKVNTMGGALALGHPLGASGLRLLMTLEGRMRREGREGDLGVATLCVGGGQGVAVLVKYRKFQARR